MIEEVDVDKLYCTQEFLDIGKLKDLKDTPIILEEMDDGNFFILDGHHRAFKKIRNEKTKIKATIVLSQFHKANKGKLFKFVEIVKRHYQN